MTNFSQVNSRIERLEARVSLMERELKAIKNTSSKTSQKQVNEINEKGTQNLDFTLNEHAFVNRFAAGKSGAVKFVLLLSYYVKGKTDEEIPLKDIKKTWSRMKAKDLLGFKYNSNYSARAKTKGWVNSKNPGSYSLSRNWKDCLCKMK